MLQTTFWNVFEIINIVSDVVLMLLPGTIIFRIQARWIRKFKVMFFFTLRIA